jgi:CubicO group peptidase (beta-lactamase class C family)
MPDAHAILSPMKVLRRIIPFAVVAVATLLLLYLPDIAPERYTDLAAFFRVEMRRQGYSGFAVAAVADGTVLYVDGFGRDGSGAKIGPDTPLYAPALAKSMAALSAYSLIRERRLSLDAPVRDFLPWFEFADGSGGDVKVRHLISHTSGLSDLSFDDAHPFAPDLETAVRSMVAAWPSFPPGKRFQYIDTDYQALALVMEKETGKPYAELLGERVFAPLGMKSSSALAQSYPPLGSASFFALPLSRPAVSSSFGASSGYVVTTASDAGQYLAFLLGPEKVGRGPVSARAVPALFEAPVRGVPYGYGFFLGQEAGERVIYHDGSLDGFSSRVTLWPDRKTGIVVLAAQSSLLQSLFALPALTSGAFRIMQEGSSPRLFPLGRLYILLAVVAIVGILAQVFQIGGALYWTKEVRDKAEAKGARGPIRFAILRCWIGIVVRATIVVLCPIVVGLAFERAVSWKILMQLEPGLAAWCMIVCVLGVLRNAARLAWIRGPAGFRRSR